MIARADVLAQLPPALRDTAGVQACWRGHAAAVAASVAVAPEPLAAIVRELAPDHAACADRWLAALGARATAGALTCGPHGIELAVDGAFEADDAIAALAVAGVAVHAAQAHNLLALVDQPRFARLTLELDGDRVEGAVIAAVPRTERTARAVDDAFGFLVRVVAPDQLATWHAVAPILFDAPANEVVMFALGTTVAWPWAELAVADRPLAHAGRLSAVLGTGLVEPAVTAARQLGGTRWSRTGVRFGSGFGPGFRLPIA